MAAADTKPLAAAAKAVDNSATKQKKKSKRKKKKDSKKKVQTEGVDGSSDVAVPTTQTQTSALEVGAGTDDVKKAQPTTALATLSSAATASKKSKRKRARSNSNLSNASNTCATEIIPAKSKSKPSSHANDATTTNKPKQSTSKNTSNNNKNGFSTIQPPLSPSILSFLSKPPYNFPTPTPVQSTTIPLFLTHHDVFVRAVTGSGKTLAFVIPVVEMILRRTTLLKRSQIGALILEPTRELARQTYTVCSDLCMAAGMNAPLLLVGGGGGDKSNNKGGGATLSATSQDLHTFAKKQSDIVIGTPGRVEDILTRYDNIDVSELEVLILDESDVLLDMGFEVTLTSILGRLPRMRRTGLFSATNASGVKRLCQRSGMRNPVVVDVAISSAVMQQSSSEGNGGGDGALVKKNGNNKQQQATPSTLTNYYILSPLDEKLSRLSAFLRQHSEEKVIIFFLTCACVEYYSTVLKKLPLPAKGYEFEPLHGKLVQKRREKAMERFRESSSGSALLCTDVAARGLDVPDVSWTIQFDAPVDPSSYVHRVGRSARAGKIGNSLVFLTRKEEAYVDFLRLRKVPLRELPESEVCKPPSAEEEEEEEGENEELEKGDSGDEAMEGSDNDGDSKDNAKSAAKATSKNNESTGGEKRVIKSSAGPDVFVTDVLPAIRKQVLKDRDVLEKGTKAYTSYIRAYKEHHCGFIFRFASLNLGLLATSFSLLRLPKMPELRDKQLHKKDFTPAGPDINIHGISFQDKAREKARQKRLAAELAQGGKNAKQIKAEQRAAERIAKSKERRAGEIAKGRNPNKKRGRQQRIFDEWDELAKEERLYKKLRTKKITQQEFDRLMYGETPKSGGGDDSD